ncbi:MAG: L-fucose/L-arabinose isomerase family protein [Rectinemataceae bacterium]
MKSSASRLAVFFGNRALFPGSLQAAARREMVEVLRGRGHEVLVMDESATRFGAVETPEEGGRFAAFLERNRGKVDGIVLCLPNFGDENGAAEAFKGTDLPILIQAYPDELGRMSPELRRDAFCGKLSIMDVFHQRDIKFTVLAPHVVSPSSEAFAENLDFFDRVCRVVKGLRDLRVGAVGARTTAFKTVRIDELALQRKGINVETYDLSSVVARLKSIRSSSAAYRDKAGRLREYSDWSGAPEETFDTLVRLGVALDELVERDRLDCLAIRCWIEMQEVLHVSPCVLLGEMNERGIASSCELDVGNAVAMRALASASGASASCLDWNNNYGEDRDKCILFHCGPVPSDMMKTKGKIGDHAILANIVGKGCSFGCDIGRIAPTDFSFASLMTEDGALRYYLGEGEFTDDPIPADFFGTGGVARIPSLQDGLLQIGRAGFRHHVSVTPGRWLAPLEEALTKYLGCEAIRF